MYSLLNKLFQKNLFKEFVENLFVKNGSKNAYLIVLYCVLIFADIDVHSGVVQTQAGVVLEKLDTQLGEHGL